MEYSFSWPPETEEANLIIILVTIGFILFWFTGKSARLLENQVGKYGPERGQERHVFIKRLVGIVSFGLFPALVLIGYQGMRWSDYGIKPQFGASEFFWIAGLSVVIILMTSRSTRAADNLEQYPEIRTQIWSKKLLIWSALSWMGYLVAYELMFRGFLLFSCVRAFGVWPAIIINTSIYALVHVPKNAKEGIGAIPLGLLLCVITLKTGNLWVALVVHWVLSLANEWFSLKHQPAMRVNQ